MWIQIDNEMAERLLKDGDDGEVLKYFQNRIRHYREINGTIEQRFREAAVRAQTAELEVDGDAVVSLGSDPGAYVMSWQWVTNREAGFDSADGSENLQLDK